MERINPRTGLNNIQAVNRFAYDHLLPALFCLLVAGMSATQLRSSIARGDGLITARIALNMAFFLLTVALFLLRRPPVGERARPFPAFLAIVATFLPMLIAGQPVHGSSNLILSSNVITLIGIVWSIVSLAALGRCFGLFPEARGLVTWGPYRWVRHPLYLGEITSSLGILMAALSPVGLVLWFLFVSLQIWRSACEEVALQKVFPGYQAYQSYTHRLIPWVW